MKTSIVHIIGIILIILGVAWTAYSLWINAKIYRIRSWPKTDATIVNAIISEDHSNYTPSILYRYTVDNREYYSTSLAYNASSRLSQADANLWYAPLKPGSIVPVYYNRGNNKESYIYNGTTNYVTVAIGFAIIAIGVYLMFFR